MFFAYLETHSPDGLRPKKKGDMISYIYTVVKTIFRCEVVVVFWVKNEMGEA